MNNTYDSDFCGLADDGEEPVLCKCGFVAAKFVAWGGCNTGRRYLACEGQQVCEHFLISIDSQCW